MIKLRRNPESLFSLSRICHRHLGTQTLPAEYTAEPEYPKIQDLSFRARKKNEAKIWQEQIRNVPTVEEKLIKINMPRYYGYKVVNFTDEKLPYHCLPAIQHYTRTVFENVSEKKSDAEAAETRQAPLADQKLDTLVQTLQPEVQEALEFTYEVYRHKYPESEDLTLQERETFYTQMVVEQLNRVLINALAAEYQHLQEVEVDLNPRHEAFWQVGGIDPPLNVIKSKEGRKWQKEMAKDPVDRLMQYKAKPYLALRHRKQLATWKSEDESVNLEIAQKLPRFKYDPRTLGFLTGYQHGTNIPGHWPGSPSGFGLLSYQSRVHMNWRPASYGAEDFKEVLHAQAVLSSYAWLLALANFNGFNTFSELTYPMNTQTIITNGRDWSFYEYQLNTLLMHTEHIDTNPRVNFCRGTGELQLYQEYDANGKCIGFNPDVLRHLVKFYTNAPLIERNATELQPYLSQEYKIAADYPNVEQRTFLEQTFKRISSNRPRHLAIPEIYLWEKIYKIDNKTRPIEAKRRFFELGINPWKRTLDQHQKEYIPRALRVNGPKDKKNKWKKTYYP